MIIIIFVFSIIILFKIIEISFSHKYNKQLCHTYFFLFITPDCYIRREKKDTAHFLVAKLAFFNSLHYLTLLN
jgi:hypothetical protein